MYVGKSRTNGKGNQILIILIIILFIWLIIASVLQRSPVGMLGAAWDYMFKDEQTYKTYNQLKEDNFQKDSVIAELEAALDMMKKSSNYQQAVVNVESDYLNMREKPELGAEVVLQLQVGSIVEVLYYDSETYRIGGDYGKWCKIRYSGKEGWVWGNYLKLID